jgi:signal transduction histidine kinase/transcriptional regulator with GAF, ATPase, and Fis domain
METRTYTAEEFVIIDRIARIVSSVRGVKTDYTHLAAELEQAVSFDIFGVVLLRHDGEAVRVMVYQRASEGGWNTDHHQRPYRESMLERMRKAPAPIVHNYPAGLDGAPAESGDALSRYHHLHSALIVPLMVENHVLGTLELGSVALNVYNDTTLQRLVTTVARLLATAIEGVQLGGNAAIQDRQRKVLQDVTSALTTKIDLSAVLQRIVSGIAEALNVSACIVLLDRSRKQLSLVAHSGLDVEALNRVFHSGILVSDKGILGQTLRSRQNCASNDIAVDERFPESHPLSDELGLHSILSVPLRTETVIHGVFFLGSSDTGGFTPLKSDIFALFANQATIAIHNSSLLDAMEKRNRFYQTVEHLEQTLQQHRNREDNFATNTDLILLEEVREATQRTFGISFTTLLRFMTEKLPSLSERMLQMDIAIGQDKEAFSLHDLLDFSTEEQRDFYATSPEKHLVQERDTQSASSSHEETLSLLAQTAETALTRAAILGGLSRLLLQLKQFTNGVNDAWFIVDLQGHCIYMNPAAEALCGVRSEGMSSVYANQLISSSVVQAQVGEPIEQIFAKLLPRMRNIDEMLLYLHELAQGNSYRQALRCDLAVEPLTQRKDDSEASAEKSTGSSDSEWRDTHYLFTSYPLSDQQGQLEATALQMQNITEQVRDEKNRSVLLSAVTHDLRTPLTTIKAAVTGLMQTEFAWSEEDRQEILVDIDSETDHLTVLVNDLVELSRIEMGALTLDKTWCDVTEIVHGAISTIEKADKRILAGRDINVCVRAPSSLIWCDHVQLQRVFFHLLKNAAHRGPASTPIDVILETSEESKEHLLIRVIDRGANIPEAERAHIFQTFNSLRSYGNGMSLAICKGLIAALQGRIWVETMEDIHISFSFTLPTHPHFYNATQHAGIDSGDASATLKEKEGLL